MEATTLIDIEVDGKVVESMRDISIPAVGDSISIPSLNIVVRVNQRDWVFDEEQSHRAREELRCVLVCQKMR